MGKFATVADYFASLEPGIRAQLELVRLTLRSAAPDAQESIAYDMPALRDEGRFLVSYAAFKKHWSLFPASQVVCDALGEELQPYLSGKGTIRFPWHEPLRLPLIERIVRVRLDELRHDRLPVTTAAAGASARVGDDEASAPS